MKNLSVDSPLVWRAPMILDVVDVSEPLPTGVALILVGHPCATAAVTSRGHIGCVKIMVMDWLPSVPLEDQHSGKTSLRLTAWAVGDAVSGIGGERPNKLASRSRPCPLPCQFRIGDLPDASNGTAGTTFVRHRLTDVGDVC